MASDAISIALVAYLIAKLVAGLPPGPLYRLSSFTILLMGVVLTFFSPSELNAKLAVLVVFALLVAVYLWSEHRREVQREVDARKRRDEAEAHRDRLERQYFDLAEKHNALHEAMRDLPNQIVRAMVYGEEKDGEPLRASIEGSTGVRFIPKAKMTFTGHRAGVEH